MKSLGSFSKNIYLLTSHVGLCSKATIYRTIGLYSSSPKILKNLPGFSKFLTRNLYVNRLALSPPKIYTRKGDGGTTSLFTGERRPKDDDFFVALGTVDELSSNIGLAKEFALENKHEYVEQLERIQCILQDIGTIIATPVPQNDDEKNAERQNKIREKMSFNKRHIEELEGWIDMCTNDLPPLTNFVLPGGGRVSAAINVCRTVCRRAERAIVPLAKPGLIDNKVLMYINRLSDYLFTISRYATILDGKKEIIYIHPKQAKESSKLQSKNESNDEPEK